MNTFLPFADFRATAECLDTLRLQKQIVEGMQLLQTFLARREGHTPKFHPVEKLWTINGEYAINELVHYINCMHDHWMTRGSRGVHLWHYLRLKLDASTEPLVWPERVHLSHRASLCLKDPEHYTWQTPWMAYHWDNPSRGVKPYSGDAIVEHPSGPTQTSSD